MPEGVIRLLLIDDHSLFREGLTRLLATEQGLELVGAYASWREAVVGLREFEVELVLLDFDLGEESGLEFLAYRTEQGLQCRVLMVTAGLSAGDTRRVLAAGAAGIFPKHRPPADLVAAIRRVVHGETWLEAGSVTALVATSAAGRPVLREREGEVLRGVFEGLANKEIGAKLGISEAYVKAILQQLFEKTGVRSRSQLVRVALEMRMLEGD